MIHLEKVTKKFNSKNGVLTAVDQVNLTINDGEIYGIIGYSGAGKSTMIRLLNGLEKPTSGSIVVNGANITQIKGAKLRTARHKISMIFQHFNLLWSRTVEENIAFTLEIAGVKKEQRSERVKQLIELVGLQGREKSYPSQLSGGQKQRVGIARALANEPEVLLCDEATSALDPETTDAILDLLVNINERLNITIVLITHEMHVIRKICNRVAVMEAGKIVEEGDVLEVFESPKEAVTQKFVQQVIETSGQKESIKQMQEQYPDGQLIKLFFVGTATERPIITQLIRKYEVEVNIIDGNISPTKSGAYGTLIVQINGTDSEVDKAVRYLDEQGIKSEVISHE